MQDEDLLQTFKQKSVMMNIQEKTYILVEIKVKLWLQEYSQLKKEMLIFYKCWKQATVITAWSPAMQAARCASAAVVPGLYSRVEI